MRAHEVAEPMLPGPSGPLAGVKIVDLTQALAGPGADVVKVEPPHGDMARMVPPFADDDTERSFGGYFASINRNKRGIVLDLKTDTGRRTLERMVEGADALVENFRAGVMDGLGLSYESLSDRNPRLVYAVVQGYGDH